MNLQPWVTLALLFLLASTPNPRKSATRGAAQDQASAKSDSARFGLRGPVKSCLEENVLPDGRAYSTYQEFSPEGKVLRYRFRNADGSEWVTTNTYDADGRLIKILSDKPGEPQAQTLYAYDDAGRLVSIRSSDSKNRTEYRYDEQGRKTEIRTFEPKKSPEGGSVGFSGSAWDAAMSGFEVPDGGRVVTVYDANDRPRELQIRDAEDHLVSRVVRTYNAAGLVVKEQPIAEDPASVLDKFPANERSQLNDAQAQTLMLLMRGQSESATLYAYDAQGRVTTESQTGGLFQTAKMTAYNDNGDIAEQRTTIISAMGMGTQYSIGENGALIPDKPTGPEANVSLDSDVHYTYQYDQYGNWTQQTTTDAKHAAPASVRRRTLTYY